MSETEISEAQKSQLALLNEKVGRWLAEIWGSYEVDADGDRFLSVGPNRVWVTCAPFGDDGTVVTLSNLILIDVQPTAELNSFIAYENGNYLFGRLSLVSLPDSGGAVAVSFDQALLGDYLDLEELKTASGVVGVIGEEIGNDMQVRFGGRHFYSE